MIDVYYVSALRLVRRAVASIVGGARGAVVKIAPSRVARIVAVPHPKLRSALYAVLDSALGECRAFPAHCAARRRGRYVPALCYVYNTHCVREKVAAAAGLWRS